jgi:carbonic anhydrase/acetyltransferase-like protein (isoleucine patch superfamily)
MSHVGFFGHSVRWMLLASALRVAYPASVLHIDPKADIHPTAVLMGNITVGPYTKIGPKAVIQGDVTIGNHVNILGNAVISVDKLTIGNYVRLDYGAKVVNGRPAVAGMTSNQVPDQSYIRDNCWIGTNATVRGSRLEEGSAVGNAAVADFNTHLEKGAVLASGAVTRFDMVIPANALAEGNPAVITKNAATDSDRQRIFGLVPAQWIHYENDNIAHAIDANPPKVRQSYPGINGRQYWRGDVKVDPTAQIHPTAILLGPVTVGAHTRIGPNAIITQATIGHHCDIRANVNIRANTAIGNNCYIGERVHVGSSRDGGFDDPLWIRNNVYIGPGSVLHATRIDDDVYYGANVMTDYGTYIEHGADLKSGTSIPHDMRIRSEAVAEGNLALMETHEGISDERQLKTLGFLPKRWLVEVHVPELDQPPTFETPLDGFDHTNKGIVKGKVNPAAILVGNVNVGERSNIAAGAYLEGNITIGKEDDIQVDTMLISNDLTIGDHTHVYDKAMIVDGRPAHTASTTNQAADKTYVGIFCWINHMAVLEGSHMEDFSNSSIGTTQSFGTRLARESLLLNGSATYADAQLPARSIAYGNPAKVRVTDSTMKERMAFFYGRDFPTWDRQATPEELKQYTLPK